MTECASIFSVDVAEFALDLADYQRLRGNDALALSNDAIAGGHMATGGAVVARWSNRLSSCLDSISELRDLLRYHSTRGIPTEMLSSLLAVREGLLNIEDALSTTLDEQRDAIWNSVPRAKRVQRFRATLDQMHLMLEAAEHAETRAARAEAAEMYSVLQRIIEERAEMDPETASSAGYDSISHDSTTAPTQQSAY